jgi:hypothetical protein
LPKGILTPSFIEIAPAVMKRALLTDDGRHTDIYCDFHEWIAMISTINKLFKLSFFRNTVRTARIDATIMEISWSQLYNRFFWGGHSRVTRHIRKNWRKISYFSAKTEKESGMQILFYMKLKVTILRQNAKFLGCKNVLNVLRLTFPNQCHKR